jgi:hypothetical protein
MDPNTTLGSMREALAHQHQLEERAERAYEKDRMDEGDALAEQAAAAAPCVSEYAQALDEWLSKGGDLPQDWKFPGSRIRGTR